MKLNLVPTHVSKEGASGGAIFVMFLLAICGIVAAVLMSVVSGSKLQASKDAEQTALSRAASVKATSDKADALMATPRVHALVRDVNLADAMESHSTVYPDLYDLVRGYVPSYYRVTSMAASPGDADTCIVTLSGVLTTYQQYADLGLAFLRIPGAQSYSPSGYQVTDKFVPPLTPADMHGRSIRPGESSIPDDAYKRLDYYMQQGHLTGYLAANGYGDANTQLKGPMPNASQVTITIALKSDPLHHYNIQTPDPRATLAASGSVASTAAAPTAFGTPPSTAAPPAPAPTPPPTPARRGKAGKKGAEGDDE